MKIEQREQQQIAIINGLELLPAIFSMELMKQQADHHPLQGQDSDDLVRVIDNLNAKQELFEEMCSAPNQLGLRLPKSEMTEAQVDAAMLRIGLEGVLEGIKKGRERRLVKRMVKTLIKSGV